MGVWNAIDSCVYVSTAKSHVERDCVDGIGINARIRHDSRLICAAPCFTPGYLAGLTYLPVTNRSQVVRLGKATAASRVDRGRASR